MAPFWKVQEGIWSLGRPPETPKKTEFSRNFRCQLVSRNEIPFRLSFFVMFVEKMEGVMRDRF